LSQGKSVASPVFAIRSLGPQYTNWQYEAFGVVVAGFRYAGV